MFIVNVEGAIRQDEKWLLIRRSEKEEHAAGELSLVGGKCDYEGVSTDILERTLQREILEEIGIEVEGLRYVNSSSFVTGTGKHVVDIVFLCHHQSGDAYPKSPDEVGEIVYMTTSELFANHEVADYLKENIKRAEQVLKESSSSKV